MQDVENVVVFHLKNIVKKDMANNMTTTYRDQQRNKKLEAFIDKDKKICRLCGKMEVIAPHPLHPDVCNRCVAEQEKGKGKIRVRR